MSKLLFFIFSILFFANCVFALERITPVEIGSGNISIKGNTHPNMRTSLLAINVPVRYDFDILPGGKYVVVLGFVEPYWEKTARVMSAQVEGAKPCRVDVYGAVGKNNPYLIAINAADINNDGVLKLKCEKHPDGIDVNTCISSVWVFDKSFWDSNNLTVNNVETGAYDSEAVYIINCGVTDSDLVAVNYRNDYNRLVNFKSMVPGYEDLQKIDKALSMYQKKDFVDFKKTYLSLGNLFLNAKDKFDKEYNPFLTQPAETRLSSPWMGIFRIRQENNLKISYMLYPKPLSDDFKYHSQGARVVFPDFVNISVVGGGHDISKTLDFKYNFMLDKIEYLPLRTKYIYKDTTISINIADDRYILINSSKKPMLISLDAANMVEKNGVWFYSKPSVDGSIFCGYVFRNAKGIRSEDSITAQTKDFAFVWADSEKELLEVADRASHFDENRLAANKWAKAAVSDLNIDSDSQYKHLMETNQQAVYSIAFKKGAYLAALDGGYLGTWLRDTTNTLVFEALAGDNRLLGQWVDYLIKNGSIEEINGKKYNAYHTFLGKTEHGKKEEDGSFYAILSCYAYWKLTGDSSKLKEWYSVLSSASEYLRNKCYEKETGLYWESYVNEASLKSAAEWAEGDIYNSLYIGKDYPLYLLSIYMNNIMYASHLMLAEIALSLENKADYEKNYTYARELQTAINKNLWNEKDGFYIPGLARTDDGRLLAVDWNYHDIFFDYVWGCTLFPMTADNEKTKKSLDSFMTKREPGTLFGGSLEKNYFAAGWGHGSYMYSAAGEYDRAFTLLDRVTSLSRSCDFNNSGEIKAIYYMPDVMHENNQGPSGHKPQGFCIGPWMHAVSSQAVYMDYNGITLIPSKRINGVEKITYRDSVINADTRIDKPYVIGVKVNNQILLNTLKIPNSFIKKGNVDISFMTSNEKSLLPVLSQSNLDVISVNLNDKSVIYELSGLGAGLLRFDREISKENITLLDSTSKIVDYKIWDMNGMTRIEFNLNGQETYTLVISK